MGAAPDEISFVADVPIIIPIGPGGAYDALRAPDPRHLGNVSPANPDEPHQNV